VPRLWPLLVVHFPAGGDRIALGDRTLAIVDDFEPTAVGDDEPAWRIYFNATPHRDSAAAALSEQLSGDGVRVETAEESDEDWARRSQEGLAPVRVGRFLILGRRPPDIEAWTSDLGPRASDVTSLTIEPSTGFGTGHHASTRLCLRLLDRVDIVGATVLDVGCGSGILSIAAALSGARRALGIDIDEDAVEAARRNLALNPLAQHVAFELADITKGLLSAPLREPSGPARADLLFGNLTGTFLARHAAALIGHMAPGGHVILSGILAEEADGVREAFGGLSLVETISEEEWIGLLLKR
jgi:ribosomal protein L11 methyltransferase